jgi:GNAT superfamily N-acetyltransferase
VSLVIRSALAHDEADWSGLWRGFLDYYGVTLDPAVTAVTWARIVDEGHRMTCRIAFVDGAAAGFAIHHHHCSTWVAGDDVYLEDLFVAPEARGRGVGAALIDDLVAIGRANGWHRLYWNTDADNAAARRLYDRFCRSDGHIRYRMTL